MQDMQELRSHFFKFFLDARLQLFTKNTFHPSALKIGLTGTRVQKVGARFRTASRPTDTTFGPCPGCSSGGTGKGLTRSVGQKPGGLGPVTHPQKDKRAWDWQSKKTNNYTRREARAVTLSWVESRPRRACALRQSASCVLPGTAPGGVQRPRR